MADDLEYETTLIHAVRPDMTDADARWVAMNLDRKAAKARVAELLEELRGELTDIAGNDWECRRCGGTIGIDHDTTQIPHHDTCVFAARKGGHDG
jgi:hypothetical protein